MTKHEQTFITVTAPAGDATDRAASLLLFLVMSSVIALVAAGVALGVPSLGVHLMGAALSLVFTLTAVWAYRSLRAI